MLTGQITDLARSWIHRVARWLLATDVRVLVGLCAGAVAVGWDGLVVDMVHYGKARKLVLGSDQISATIMKNARLRR